MQGDTIFRQILAFFLVGSLAVSCQKAKSLEPATDDYELPGEICYVQAEIIGDTQVTAGERLTLYGKAINARLLPPRFEWTLPNGNIQGGDVYRNYEVRLSDSGAYIFTVYDAKECMAQAAMTVSVLPAMPDCSPDINTMTIDSDIDTFSNVFCSKGNSYNILASSGDYTVNIIFSGDSATVGDLYRIVNADSYEDLKDNEVIVELKDQTGAISKARNGNVYITVENNLTTYTFCNARFETPTWNFSSTGKFVCP